MCIRDSLQGPTAVPEHVHHPVVVEGDIGMQRGPTVGPGHLDDERQQARAEADALPIGLDEERDLRLARGGGCLLYTSRCV